MKRVLGPLREELRQQTADRNDSDGSLAQIALKHLDRYWRHLMPEQSLAAGECWQRTTNQLESDWGGLKRRRRLLGELPRRLLREAGFVDHLLDACIHYCQFPAPPAA